MTIKYLATAALALCLPQIAQAAPITFFGEELAPGATVTGDPLTQRNLFVNTLAAGVGTESFESATLPNISFPVSSGNVTATLSGGGASIEGSPGAGRFATSGSNYVETTGGGDFVIDFSSAIAAFGFYGTDIGDINNSLSLRLTKSGGGTVDLDVGNTIGAASGSLLFFGFLDTVDSYTSIEFINAPGGGDVFGFDDMIVGDTGQIVNPPPSAVPLPAAGWMLIAGLGGLGLMGRRKKA